MLGFLFPLLKIPIPMMYYDQDLHEPLLKKSSTVVLKTFDGKTFEVDKTVAEKSHTIKHMIEHGSADTIIPLLNVTSKILSKVIKYCKKHIETPNTDEKVTIEDLKAFDAEFVRVDQDTLFNLILATHYLDIKSLLDLTFQTLADIIKRKTPAEVRKMFYIDNYTPEEQEEMLRVLSLFRYPEKK